MKMFRCLFSFWQIVSSAGVLMIALGGCTRERPGYQTLSPQRATSRSYTVKGKRYHPQQHYELDQVGIASFYGQNDRTHGCPTAMGERFNAYALTAAHKTLPLPCVVRVTNLENGRQVILRVNDRGPYKYDRIIDVSVAAAKKLGFYKKGLARVRVQTLVGHSLALKKNRKFRRQQLMLSSQRSSPRLMHKSVRSSLSRRSPPIRQRKSKVEGRSVSHPVSKRSVTPQGKSKSVKRVEDFIFF